ncbi:uncharacterized protein LOC110861351 [Folsomia candida]|uniref:Uncharacterized protein n=1 Tax=Folsomia candida TaxID=158441 RepID=A0A226D3A5_FOLCA|nr:uncharacterized protein LOC110861351 [Folsomia candida]OXA39227.1 hypothetical protein Fcan01_26045 [Folsomia candida]
MHPKASSPSSQTSTCIHWSSSSSMPPMSKVLLVTLAMLTLYSVLVSGAGYLGPRYGKRLPLPMQGGEVSRIVGRSSGPRTIQSRSQARFYAGSRYGGKRSYWPSLMQSDVDSSLDSGANNASPYDCVYLPYVGIRCGVLRSESAFSSGGSDHDPAEDMEMSPSSSSYGGGSPSLTRTSIIDTVPSSGSGSSDN